MYPTKQKYQHHINYANIYEGQIIMDYLDADKNIKADSGRLYSGI